MAGKSNPPALATVPRLFDRALQRKRIARTQAGFGNHAVLHRRIAQDLADRIALVNRRFPTALVISHGAGGAALAAEALRGVGTIDHMVTAALAGQGNDLTCDDGMLPFAAVSLDLIVSVLSLHLVDDLPGALVQMRRALKPDGLLVAGLLGGRTLIELKHVLSIVEGELTGGVSPRVAPFADVRDLGGLLQRAGFALPVADSDTITLTYDEPLALLADLRGAGCSNTLVERSAAPTTRRFWHQVDAVYRSAFSGADGRVPATFEVVTLTGWAPHESQQKPLAPGSARTRLAAALGVPEQRAGEPVKRGI